MAIFRHVISGTTPGEIWTWTMHTDSTLEVDAAQAAWTTAVSGYLEDGSPPLTNSFPTSVVATQTSTALLSGATGAQVTRRISAINIPGTSADEMLPYQIAVAVSLRTDLATRAGRGRFYLPPVSTTLLADGRIPAANVELLADRSQDFLQALATAGLDPVIYHRASNDSTPVTSVDVGDVFDTQRRRRNSLIEVRESRPL